MGKVSRNDFAKLLVELSEEDRARMSAYDKMSYGEKLDLLISEGRMTCSNCEDNQDCEFAFNLYNTDGDCLWEK